MKIHRFIGDFTTTAATIEITTPELVHQMNRVLKLTPGETIIVSDGRGIDTEAMITEITKKNVLARIISIQRNPNEPKKHVTLYLAILKRDNFELSVQKAVEVGVSTIVPIITERTIKSGLNTKRIETIIREAAEQSGRGIVPKLGDTLTLTQAIAQCTPKETVLFDLSGKETSYSKITSLFIGPEGGFSSVEVTLAHEHGITIGSLGALTLRGETAAIIASYQLVHG